LQWLQDPREINGDNLNNITVLETLEVCFSIAAVEEEAIVTHS
jgi:hypothetical protein